MFQQLYFGKIHTKLTTKGLGENYYNGMYLTGKNLAQAYMSNDKKWLNYGTSQIKVFPHIPGAWKRERCSPCSSLLLPDQFSSSLLHELWYMPMTRPPPANNSIYQPLGHYSFLIEHSASGTSLPLSNTTPAIAAGCFNIHPIISQPLRFLNSSPLSYLSHHFPCPSPKPRHHQ